MKRIYLLTLVAIALIYSSCTVEKRHYMSGYHVEWNHKAPKIGGDGNTTVENNEAPKVSNPVENTETTITETSVTSVNSSEKNITYKAEVTENAEIPATIANHSNEKVEVKSQTIAESTTNEIASSIMESSKATQSGAAQENSDTDILLLLILAIFIPPLAVFLKEGSWNARCWIALLLWFLFVIPGVIYALLIVLDAI